MLNKYLQSEKWKIKNNFSYQQTWSCLNNSMVKERQKEMNIALFIHKIVVILPENRSTYIRIF